MLTGKGKDQVGYYSLGSFEYQVDVHENELKYTTNPRKMKIAVRHSLRTGTKPALLQT